MNALLLVTMSGSVYRLQQDSPFVGLPRLSRQNTKPLMTDNGYADLSDLHADDPFVVAWYIEPDRVGRPRAVFVLEDGPVITTSPIVSMAVRDTPEYGFRPVPFDIDAVPA